MGLKTFASPLGIMGAVAVAVFSVVLVRSNTWTGVEDTSFARATPENIKNVTSAAEHLWILAVQTDDVATTAKERQRRDEIEDTVSEAEGDMVEALQHRRAAMQALMSKAEGLWNLVKMAQTKRKAFTTALWTAGTNKLEDHLALLHAGAIGGRFADAGLTRIRGMIKKHVCPPKLKHCPVDGVKRLTDKLVAVTQDLVTASSTLHATTSRAEASSTPLGYDFSDTFLASLEQHVKPLGARVARLDCRAEAAKQQECADYAGKPPSLHLLAPSRLPDATSTLPGKPRPGKEAMEKVLAWLHRNADPVKHLQHVTMDGEDEEDDGHNVSLHGGTNNLVVVYVTAPSRKKMAPTPLGTMLAATAPALSRQGVTVVTAASNRLPASVRVPSTPAVLIVHPNHTDGEGQAPMLVDTDSVRSVGQLWKVMTATCPQLSSTMTWPQDAAWEAILQTPPYQAPEQPGAANTATQGPSSTDSERWKVVIMTTVLLLSSCVLLARYFQKKKQAASSLHQHSPTLKPAQPIKPSTEPAQAARRPARASPVANVLPTETRPVVRLRPESRVRPQGACASPIQRPATPAGSSPVRIPGGSPPAAFRLSPLPMCTEPLVTQNLTSGIRCALKMCPELVTWLVDTWALSLVGDLGKGGLARVRKAIVRGREVAVKTILQMNDFGARTLTREVMTMMEVEMKPHPNLMPWLGSYVTRFEAGVVLPLMHGGDLCALLRKPTPLTWAVRLDMLKQIAQGIQHLHNELGIVHGDIKSQNVLLADAWTSSRGKAPRVVVSDYGVARKHEKAVCARWFDGCFFPNSFYKGSVEYSAPEVLNNRPSTYATDVYAFGVLMYEAIVRKTPWIDFGRQVGTFEQMVREGRRPTCCGPVPMSTPAGWQDLVERCWAHDAAARPSMDTVIAELDRLQVY